MSNSATLLAGGAHASNLCLSLLSTNPAFLALSQSEGTGIADRDAEDGHMLSAGIMSSLANNVLSPADKTTVPYTPITVDGKTPAEVSDIIMSSLAPPTAGGRVITVVGLSGVGKGTTVATLKASLAATRADKNAENVMCWSNGNIFRSLTMLTSLYMQEKGLSDLNEAIAGGGSKELKKTLLGCLTFEVNPATKEFDTHIVGFGVDYWVKDIEVRGAAKSEWRRASGEERVAKSEWRKATGFTPTRPASADERAASRTRCPEHGEEHPVANERPTKSKLPRTEPIEARRCRRRKMREMLAPLAVISASSFVHTRVI